MALAEVFSRLAIVGQRSVAEGVGHSETVIGFHDCGDSSLQLLELSVKLVDEFDGVFAADDLPDRP